MVRLEISKSYVVYQVNMLFTFQYGQIRNMKLQQVKRKDS